MCGLVLWHCRYVSIFQGRSICTIKDFSTGRKGRSQLFENISKWDEYIIKNTMVKWSVTPPQAHKIELKFQNWKSVYTIYWGSQILYWLSLWNASLHRNKVGKKGLKIDTIIAIDIWIFQFKIEVLSVKMLKHATQLIIIDSIVINVHIWVMFLCTFLANAVTELCVWMFLDISFYLVPISFIISNFFTMRADGEKPT